MSILNHTLLSLERDTDPNVDRVTPAGLPTLPAVLGVERGEIITTPPATAPSSMGGTVAPGQTSVDSGAKVDAAALAAAVSGTPTAPATPTQDQTAPAPTSTPQSTAKRSMRRQTTASFNNAVAASKETSAGEESNHALAAFGGVPCPSTETAANNRSRVDTNFSALAVALKGLKDDVASREVVVSNRMEEVLLLGHENRVAVESNKVALESLATTVDGLQNGLAQVFNTVGDVVVAGNTMHTSMKEIDLKLDAVMTRIAELTSVATPSSFPSATTLHTPFLPPTNPIPTAYPSIPGVAAAPQASTSTAVPRTHATAFPQGVADHASKRRNTGSGGNLSAANNKVDVHVYPVVKYGNANIIANSLLTALGMGGIRRPYHSVIRLTGRDEVISIRFNSEATAQTFIHKMINEQPPDANGQKVVAKLAGAETADPWAMIRGNASASG